MKQRSSWLVLVTVGALFALLLVAGCGSGTTVGAQLETSLSVDNTTHRATVHINTTGGSEIIAVFLAYPDGHRGLLGSGNVGGGGVNLVTEELSQGEYSYTVYATPQGPQDSGTLPASKMGAENVAATGKFVIP